MPDDAGRLILPGEGDRAELREKAAKYDTLRPLCEEMLAYLKQCGCLTCITGRVELLKRAEAALKLEAGVPTSQIATPKDAFLLVFEEMQAALKQVSKTHDLTARALQRAKALKGGE